MSAPYPRAAATFIFGASSGTCGLEFLEEVPQLDCVLAPSKTKVLEAQAKYKGKLEDLGGQLRKASGFAFYNTSRYDFEKLLADAPHLAANLRNYIAGFSANMREVLEKFDFDNTISKLEESGPLITHAIILISCVHQGG